MYTVSEINFCTQDLQISYFITSSAKSHYSKLTMILVTVGMIVLNNEISSVGLNITKVSIQSLSSSLFALLPKQVLNHQIMSSSLSWIQMMMYMPAQRTPKFITSDINLLTAKITLSFKGLFSKLFLILSKLMVKSMSCQDCFYMISISSAVHIFQFHILNTFWESLNFQSSKTCLLTSLQSNSAHLLMQLKKQMTLKKKRFSV